MKKKLLVFSLFTLLSLTGCSGIKTTSASDVNGNTSAVEIPDDTITGDFILQNESSVSISPVDGVYTISAAGTYKASGKLSSGQILINAVDAEVELDLEGVSIANSSKSPIFVQNCADFDLKASKGTNNYIYDYRNTDYSQSDTEPRGAIYSENGDIKVKGTGTLSIISNKNSGIHGKDNVTIKNVTMLIKAMNNGIRGNDKVTIEENPTLGIVAGNNGIVTHNYDQGSNGAQHGNIYITGGTTTINSYGDGIDAAWGCYISQGTDTEGNTYTPVIDIYTNIYSSYTLNSSSSIKYAPPGGGGHGGGGGFDDGGWGGGSSAEKANDSAKAIKANDTIDISAGNIFTYTYDDGIHSNKDNITGLTTNGHVNINGGTLNLKASDDAIHADGTLTINDGTINVPESHEGLEGNQIIMNGGKAIVSGKNDGVNASTSITINGGYLDVTVPNSDDVDGIDSNGTYTQKGGIVITRGPNSTNMAALDTDGTCSISGGTLIVLGSLGSRGLTKGSGISTYSLSLHSQGSQTVKINGETLTFTNAYSYGKTQVYSSVNVSK